MKSRASVPRKSSRIAAAAIEPERPATRIPPLSQIDHCLDKIEELCRKGESDALTTREVFQIGYNVGRAAELAGEGREQWWDLFKGAVESEEWGVVADLASQKREALLGH